MHDEEAASILYAQRSHLSPSPVPSLDLGAEPELEPEPEHVELKVEVIAEASSASAPTASAGMPPTTTPAKKRHLIDLDNDDAEQENQVPRRRRGSSTLSSHPVVSRLRHVACLEGTNLVDDVVVNQLIRQFAATCPRPTGLVDSLTVSSILSESARRPNRGRFRELDGQAAFVIPIHRDSHWCLAYWVAGTGEAAYYNSMSPVWVAPAAAERVRRVICWIRGTDDAAEQKEVAVMPAKVSISPLSSPQLLSACLTPPSSPVPETSQHVRLRHPSPRQRGTPLRPSQ